MAFKRISPITGRLRMPKPITGKIPGFLPNKGSQQAMLPSRAALRMLRQPGAQSLGNYAKMTPSGAATIDQPYSGIMDAAQNAGVAPIPEDSDDQG